MSQNNPAHIFTLRYTNTVLPCPQICPNWSLPFGLSTEILCALHTSLCTLLPQALDLRIRREFITLALFIEKCGAENYCYVNCFPLSRQTLKISSMYK